MSDTLDPENIDSIQYFVGNAASHIGLTIAQSEILARVKILTGEANPPLESVKDEERESLDALRGIALESLETDRPDEVDAEDLADLLQKILSYQKALLQSQAELISHFSGRTAEAHHEEWLQLQESAQAEYRDGE